MVIIFSRYWSKSIIRRSMFHKVYTRYTPLIIQFLRIPLDYTFTVMYTCVSLSFTSNIRYISIQLVFILLLGLRNFTWDDVICGRISVYLCAFYTLVMDSSLIKAVRPLESIQIGYHSLWHSVYFIHKSRRWRNVGPMVGILMAKCMWMHGHTIALGSIFH